MVESDGIERIIKRLENLPIYSWKQRGGTYSTSFDIGSNVSLSLQLRGREQTYTPKISELAVVANELGLQLPCNITLRKRTVSLKVLYPKSVGMEPSVYRESAPLGSLCRLYESIRQRVIDYQCFRKKTRPLILMDD